jgi:autotransporter-associated beta strand protein
MKLLLPIIVALTMGCALGQVNITTYQVDSAHTGQNLNETVLTPSTISATGAFGALFTQPLDGQCYTQPLYMSNVKIADGSIHNIVFVATQHDSVYAFDADTPNIGPLWHTSFLSSGVTTVPTSSANTTDITNEIGITATPVIDPSTNTLYTVSKTKNTAAGTYDQYLHALDITTGAEKFGGPVSLDSILTNLDTSAAMLRQHLRGSLELSNGNLYLAYASHSDVQPYHGLLLAFNATTLALVNSFNDTPHGIEGGIWGAGAGPAIDSAGNLFFTTGNGTFDQTNAGAFDLSETFVRLPPATTTAGSFYPNTTTGYFTLSNQSTLTSKDLDLGSSGVLLLPNQTGGTHPHIMVSGGKAGMLYVVDRDTLGGYNGTNQDIQEISEGALFCSPSYFNGNIYYAPAGGPLTQRAVGYNSATGGYISTTSTISSQTFTNHGSSAFISANSANLSTSGIVWIINGATPSTLYAYNPANVAAAPYVTFTTSYNNGTSVVNSTCNKFAIPTVVNGKVYLTGYDSSLTTGRLYVLGLLSANSGPVAPSNLTATPTSSTQVTLNWTDNSSNESGFHIYRSTSSTGPFTTLVGMTGANISTYSDPNLNPQTTYYYQVNAYNSVGSSTNTATASATTFAPFSQPGLVAYWNFDEGTGSIANDVTGDGHTATLNGEFGWVPGLIGNAAMNFHGTGDAVSNAVVPAAAPLEFSATQSFTLSAWADPGALRSSDAGVICASRDQGAYYGIWINSSNQWVFRGGVVGGSQTDVVGPTATQNWTHVAVVQDGAAGTRTLYINGVAVATGAAQAANGAGDFWIGQANSVEQPFAGTVDEVRLYNVALTATQIQGLLGPPGPPLNLSWSGATSTAWNVSTDWPWDLSTANWLNGGAAADYFDGDNLTFPDGAATSTVVVSAAVNPGSIIFTNATSTYAVSGAAISGATSLAMNGAGTVTLSSADAYTGGTTINVGKINLPGANGSTAFTAALGAGTITLNGGELLLDPPGGSAGKTSSTFTNNFVLNGGILYANDGQEHLTGTISVTAATTLLRQWNNSTADQTKALLLDGVLSGGTALNLYGTGGYTSQGARTWIDNAANTYSGTVTVYASAALSGFSSPLGGFSLGIGSDTALQSATVDLEGTRPSGSTDATELYGVQFGSGVTAPVLGALQGNGNINLNNLGTGTPAATLTAGGDNATTTFAGILSGTGGFTKAGSGIMTLSSGANTYTGATTVSGGELIIVGPFTSSSSVSIASGATLDVPSGNFSTSGTITNNGTLVLGSGVTLSSTGTFTNNGTLDLTNDPTYTPSGNFVNNGTVLTVPPADTPTAPPWALITIACLLFLIGGGYFVRKPSQGHSD